VALRFFLAWVGRASSSALTGWGRSPHTHAHCKKFFFPAAIKPFLPATRSTSKQVFPSPNMFIAENKGPFGSFSAPPPAEAKGTTLDFNGSKAGAGFGPMGSKKTLSRRIRRVCVPQICLRIDSNISRGASGRNTGVGEGKALSFAPGRNRAAIVFGSSIVRRPQKLARLS